MILNSTGRIRFTIVGRLRCDSGWSWIFWIACGTSRGDTDCITIGHTCLFKVVCLTVFLFKVWPWAFTIEFCGKKSIRSETMVLERSCVMHAKNVWNSSIQYMYMDAYGAWHIPCDSPWMTPMHAAAEAQQIPKHHRWSAANREDSTPSQTFGSALATVLLSPRYQHHLLVCHQHQRLALETHPSRKSEQTWQTFLARKPFSDIQAVARASMPGVGFHANHAPWQHPARWKEVGIEVQPNLRETRQWAGRCCPTKTHQQGEVIFHQSIARSGFSDFHLSGQIG